MHRTEGSPVSRSAMSPWTGLDALRYVVADELVAADWLMAGTRSARRRPSPGPSGRPPGTDEEHQRIAALVDLARDGDHEAFGQLYDHYSPAVYRFIYYRLSGNKALAEDLTSETFFRALRSMASFHWQGKDFGAWLTTIARNLVLDHVKSGRNRLELVTEDFSGRTETVAGPEDEVLANLTNEALREALSKLPDEQQECLVLRFLNGYSIAETAASLGRSEGAVKQLQLRAVRNLAKQIPAGLR